jgi:hypothetical protein
MHFVCLMCRFQMLWTMRSMLPVRCMNLEGMTILEMLLNLQPFDICVGSYQLLWTTKSKMLPVRYMGLEDTSILEMLHYIRQFDMCVSNYQAHQTHKSVILPLRYTVWRHSQHLRSRVVFDRNLIDCLNLKLKQKQRARRKPPQSKGRSRIAKNNKTPCNAHANAKTKTQKTPMQCNAYTKNAVLYGHLGRL